MITEKARPEILSLIRQHYPQLAERNLQDAIADEGTIMHFKAGSLIMDFGAYVKIMPLIIKGSIKVSREDEEGNELFLYYLKPGETCSMSFTCCLMDKKSEIRTVAEEDTTLIGIPTRFMDEWMSRYPSWKNFVMTSYDNRMLELVRTIDSIAFKKMDERLMDYLEQKAEANNSRTLNATHQEIAYDLNASREAISRLLKQLEKDGVVQLGRNRIELL
ncbi:MULTISPECIES: Crp/Fnr family transcriptional regulator [Phaeodactylibacter]|jgi:CRP/FNR family transcriptional regulator|uniref:Crp/Fnr family transcriptional regulator n=3 Tax=Phaeodactylibacter TaxID=1564515 RepID=A0A098RYZ2_9BACT|nr:MULTISPECIES: Crp/Fnr family transcriptional regulator [Phaeodactylibacter]KGE85140.1 Crp/Fnr family transcriptional regulator [Phaeodactylibacter xiamenensis]MCI5089434.1 Crp/Fnr family transcriptional regulator [Phaeodactylibacter sp.]MCR9051752.1 Crp/Fnr family transcriptional regulator [bacterium]